MANYDNKLGEWFKQVEAQEQELKAKKTGHSPHIREEAKSAAAESVGTPRIAGVQIEGPAREAPMSVVATMETVGVVADTSLAGTIPPAGEDESAAKLFTQEDVPPVEDFFSFLGRTAEAPVVEEVEECVFELPKDQSTLGPSEGTGEPRPVPAAPEAPPPPAETPQAQQQLIMTPPPPAKVEAPMPIEIPRPPVEPQPAPDAGAQASPALSGAEGWDRMPKHLQTLFGASAAEVAQNSYKAFKESREDLIQRLLDPTVSLEEAARVLNVCPTTVRRYTNRNVLRHYRTAGNQRRFKLSDVLAFMETGSHRASAEGAQD